MTPTQGVWVRRGGPLLLTEHVEEGELDAMEAALRYCYTGQLSDGTDSAVQLEAPELLKIMILADRFGMTSCLTLCCQSFSGRTLSLDTVNQIYSMPPGVSASQPFRPVTCAAETWLCECFGRPDAVCAAWDFSPEDAEFAPLELREYFTALLEIGAATWLRVCHEAVMALFTCGKLAALSEHSVLLLAHLWATGPLGKASTPAQLRQLVAVLRLSNLSFTFLYDVLPRLQWLQITAAEKRSLRHFFAANEGKREALVEGGIFQGPAGWFGSPPRPSQLFPDRMSKALRVTTDASKDLLHCMHVLEWDFSEIQEQLAIWASTPDVQLESDRTCFFNSFTLHMRLCYCAEPRPHCFAILYPMVVLGGKPRRRLGGITAISLSLVMRMSWSQARDEWSAPTAVVFNAMGSRQGRALPDVLCGGSPDAVLQLANWGDKLIDGRLSLEAIVVSCDGSAPNNFYEREDVKWCGSSDGGSGSEDSSGEMEDSEVSRDELEDGDGGVAVGGAAGGAVGDAVGGAVGDAVQGGAGGR